jgi:L-fucose isomerase-like protein
MKNHVWGYVIGIAIFAMVVGIWVWQLPNIIAHASHGEDKGLAGLMSTFGGAKTAVNSGLAKAQVQLDLNLKSVSKTMAAEEAQAAVVQNLKNKITAGATAAK